MVFGVWDLGFGSLWMFGSLGFDFLDLGFGDNGFGDHGFGNHGFGNMSLGTMELGCWDLGFGTNGVADMLTFKSEMVWTSMRVVVFMFLCLRPEL